MAPYGCGLGVRASTDLVKRSAPLKSTLLKALAIALALLDFAPVFFLSLGLFFLAQLVDRLDPKCRKLALSGFLLVTLGALARAASNLSLAILEQEIPVLATSLYVFAGPGFTLMAGALIRSRATWLGLETRRDPWLAPTLLSWLFLLAAFYLNSAFEGRGEWQRVLLALALFGSAATCLAAARLGWTQKLHMAAALFAFNLGGTSVFVLLRYFVPQGLLIQLVGEVLNLAAQAAFAFASWRVAAEFHARVGPTAPV